MKYLQVQNPDKIKIRQIKNNKSFKRKEKTTEKSVDMESALFTCFKTINFLNNTKKNKCDNNDSSEEEVSDVEEDENNYTENRVFVIMEEINYDAEAAKSILSDKLFNKDYMKFYKSISMLDPSERLADEYILLSILMGRNTKEKHIGPPGLFKPKVLENCDILKIYLNYSSNNNIDTSIEERNTDEDVFSGKNGRIKKQQKKSFQFENKKFSKYYKGYIVINNCAIYNVQMSTNIKNNFIRKVYALYYLLVTCTILVDWIRKNYKDKFEIVLINSDNNIQLTELFTINNKVHIVYNLLHKYNCYYSYNIT